MILTETLFFPSPAGARKGLCCCQHQKIQRWANTNQTQSWATHPTPSPISALSLLQIPGISHLLHLYPRHPHPPTPQHPRIYWASQVSIATLLEASSLPLASTAMACPSSSAPPKPWRLWSCTENALKTRAYPESTRRPWTAWRTSRMTLRRRVRSSAQFSHFLFPLPLFRPAMWNVSCWKGHKWQLMVEGGCVEPWERELPIGFGGQLEFKLRSLPSAFERASGRGRNVSGPFFLFHLEKTIIFLDWTTLKSYFPPTPPTSPVIAGNHTLRYTHSIVQLQPSRISSEVAWFV